MSCYCKRSNAPTRTFPPLEFESRGYTVAVHGQKTYNGVAIVSRHKLTDIRAGLPEREGRRPSPLHRGVGGGRRRARGLGLSAQRQPGRE